MPAEVKQGLPYIFLAFGGVCVNLVGVLFFMYAGEDAQCPHGGGFLAAHSHSHDHGCERLHFFRILRAACPRVRAPMYLHRYYLFRFRRLPDGASRVLRAANFGIRRAA